MRAAAAVEALLFDLDDTLLNTEELLDATMVAVMQQEYGVAVSHASLARLRGCVDVGPEGWTTKLIAEYGLGAQVTDQQLCDRVYSECNARMTEAKPMAGALELVALGRKLGLRCAIVTSSTTASAHLKLSAHADTIWAHMEHVVCVDDVAPHAKPHPRPYLLACERLGVAPERCLVFEDSLPGVRSGVAAGATVIAVPAADARDAAAAAGAHAVVASLLDFDLQALLLARAAAAQAQQPE